MATVEVKRNASTTRSCQLGVPKPPRFRRPAIQLAPGGGQHYDIGAVGIAQRISGFRQRRRAPLLAYNVL